MQNIRSGFQKGDVPLVIAEQTYRLRLTMGALAEIDARLGVKGPLELARKIREIARDARNNREAMVLLACLLCPQCDGENERISALIARAKPTHFMPAIAQLFEQNFA